MLHAGEGPSVSQFSSAMGEVIYPYLPPKVPSVAEWSKALESDASAGGESPVRAPVRAATLCPYA